MILLFIILYVLIGLCSSYGFLIYDYKRHYSDHYSFKEAITYFDDEVCIAVVIGIFFPLALVVYVCWLIGHLIMKLLNKIVK